MYHDYISRKIKPIKSVYNFVKDKETLLQIVNQMFEPNAETLYPHYHVYKDIISDFTFQIISLDNQLNVKNVILDISDNFIDDFKEIILKEKSKSILELLKNKNIIYEKNV